MEKLLRTAVLILVVFAFAIPVMASADHNELPSEGRWSEVPADAPHFEAGQHYQVNDGETITLYAGMPNRATDTEYQFADLEAGTVFLITRNSRARGYRTWAAVQLVAGSNLDGYVLESAFDEATEYNPPTAWSTMTR